MIDDAHFIADRPMPDGRSLHFKISREMIGEEPVIKIAHVVTAEDRAEEQRAAVVIEYDLLDQIIEALTAFMPASIATEAK